MISIKHKNGSALIISLVIALIVSTLGLFAISVSRNILYSSKMLMDKLQSELIADSTVEKIKFYASTGKFHSNFISNPNYKIIGLPQKLYIDGRKQSIDNHTILKVHDTGAKIDVVYPFFSAVRRLFMLKGVKKNEANIIHDSLLDWYDKGNLHRLNGAEDYYYKFDNGFLYGSRNFRGVQSIYEWSIIRGLNDNLTFNKIKPYLSFEFTWKPNLNTMDKYMLAAVLNVPLDTAEEIVNLRKIKGALGVVDIEHIAMKDINPEIYGLFPTFSLDIDGKINFNTADVGIKCSIDFKSYRSRPYTVLKWKY